MSAPVHAPVTRRIRAASERRPWLLDGSLALVCFAATLLAWWTDEYGHEGDRDVDAGFWLIVGLVCLSLLWRRTRPCEAMGVAGFSITIGFLLGYPEPPATLALIVLLYSVALYSRSRRDALVVLAITAACVLVIVIAGEDDVNGVFVTVSNAVIFGAAFLLGDSIRYRRAYQAELEERAGRLERDQAERAAAAVRAERARITRELHDVVAHGVSVMVVQAGAARRSLGDDRPDIGDVLGNIESTGREALDELRRVLAVLRGTSGAGTDPQPGLSRLPELVEQCADAGLAVRVEVTEPLPPLSAGAELTLYRIAQEALTNVLKHAGPASAVVALRGDDDAVVLTVTDDGRGGSAALGTEPGSVAGGHGLVGMRERLELFGGELDCGPRTGGGWFVRAVLPHQPARATSAEPAR